MTYVEIPSDDQVVEALAQLAGRATARALCEKLVVLGYPRPDSQIAIQRAIERDRVLLEANWMLSIPENADQAA